MAFSRNADRPVSELQAGGVAISCADGQAHIGILYRSDPQTVRFSHLRWHHLFTDEIAPSRPFVWDHSPFLEDATNSTVFAAQLIRIRKSKNVIAYGFFFTGEAFESDGTLIEFEKPGMGLTCATYVMAVYGSIGFELCLQNTWPSRAEDREWQRSIIRKMVEYKNTAPVTCEHVWGMKRYVGTPRFRPEEVAVAAASDSTPLKFEEALKLADELRALIEA